LDSLSCTSLTELEPISIPTRSFFLKENMAPHLMC
jgi:hypothetical protein